MTTAPMLEVEKLEVTLDEHGVPITIVDGVSFTIMPGEIVGLVGESGSGKTMTAMALLRLLPPGARTAGHVRLGDEDLLALPETSMRRVRGGQIGMVFQEPMAALNPSFTIGSQIVAAIRAHRNCDGRAARERALELLAMVSIPDPRKRFAFYPHQLSGGMCQRVMIAMALAGGARLLVADEPTSSLDVTIQHQIVSLLERLVREVGISVLFISHDLALVARICDRIAVAYAGQIVEHGPARALLEAPRHPYTQALVRCVAHLDQPGVLLRGIPGSPPLPAAWPVGCRFSTRCPEARPGCADPQSLVEIEGDRMVRCWVAALGQPSRLPTSIGTH